MASLMLDIETLGTQPDTVILTVGAIKFNPASDAEPFDGLYCRLDVNEQLRMGRSVDDSTLEWWNSQKQDVRNEALSDEDRTGLLQFTKELNRAVVGVSEIWAQGPTFDFTILENLYKQLGVPVPWHYWQIRDSRTLFKVVGEPRIPGRDQAHNALADCYYQARGIQQIYKQLNLNNSEK